MEREGEEEVGLQFDSAIKICESERLQFCFFWLWFSKFSLSLHIPAVKLLSDYKIGHSTYKVFNVGNDHRPSGLEDSEFKKNKGKRQ